MTMFQNLGRMMGEGATLKIECQACWHDGAIATAVYESMPQWP